MSGPDTSIVVRCDCSDLGHLIIFDAWHWDTDKPQYSQLLAHMELETSTPWWKRILLGARYALTGKVQEWWWTDSVINDASAAALRDFLSDYLGQSLNTASVDTRPEGGDSTKIEAPFTGGAVVSKASETPNG